MYTTNPTIYWDRLSNSADEKNCRQTDMTFPLHVHFTHFVKGTPFCQLSDWNTRIRNATMLWFPFHVAKSSFCLLMLSEWTCHNVCIYNSTCQFCKPAHHQPTLTPHGTSSSAIRRNFFIRSSKSASVQVHETSTFSFHITREPPMVIRPNYYWKWRGLESFFVASIVVTIIMNIIIIISFWLVLILFKGAAS